jgi:hypothetical protein
MIRKRGFALAGLAVVTLALILGCSLATEKVQTGTGVELFIGNTGLSRLLTVVEYDVTSLDIVLRNGEVEIYSFTWYPYSSNSRIFIPILTAGTFDIDVTHHGEKDGETISVTENAKFRIKLGIITLIKIVPGMVGVIDVEPVEEPEPFNLTGHWDVTWTFDSGVVFGPMYSYMNQIGNTISMAYGFEGTLDGNILTVSGILGGDPPQILKATATVIDENTVECDYFDIRDLDTGEIADWGFGPLVGSQSMVRSDPSDFGHLDLTGSAVTPYGVANMDLDTDWSRASTSVNSEEWEDEFGTPMVSEWQTLDIGFVTDVYDVGLWIRMETSSGSFGAGQEYQFPYPGPVEVSVRYLENGVGIDESSNMGEPLLFSGTLYIDEWNVVEDSGGQVVDGYVEGRIMATGTNNMTASFSIPFTPPTAF